MIAIASSPLPALPIRQVMGVAHYLPQSALPEVPGLGARAMARRTASRTPSRAVFPRRLHHAGPRRRDRLPEQGRRLCHPVPLRGRDARHHRGRPQASRRSARRDRRPPYLGPDPVTPSAYPLRRARRWTFARWHTLGRLPARLLPAGARPLPAIPPPVSADLQAASRLASWASLAISPTWPIPPHRRAPRSTPTERLGRLCQAAIRRARTGAGLSRPLYASRRHRQQSADFACRWQGELFLEGLSAES